MIFRSGILVCLWAAVTAHGQTRIQFDTLAPDLIQNRLALVPQRASEREPELESLFREAGCEGDRLSEQPIPHTKEANVICTLAGEGPGTIVVGAHTDFVAHSTGAVDDWSGSALLPSLFQSLKSYPRRHNLVLIGFGAEEVGLLGSKEYVRTAEKASIRAMINLECLGVSPPKIWSSRADKNLREAYVQVASSLHVAPAGVNVERVGDDDSHPFLNARIPVLTIHSITQETFPLLHSPRDTLKAINPDDYYAAYRITVAYLA